MNFEHYVAGRSIAVVGPAPLTHDQSAEIDAHDLVYRPEGAPTGGWYGERLDIAYLNGAAGRTILDPDMAHICATIDRATWWVFKSRNRSYRPGGYERVAHRPAAVDNPNAITGILWDLSHFSVGSITVYGTDLYAGGPGNAYHPDYITHQVRRQAEAFLAHRPWQQMNAHRALVATGLIRGDDRYLAAVTMPDDQYQAVIDSWTQAAQPLT